MDLNRQILLCYSEKDNELIEGGLKGWVSNFHKFLSTLLSQISRDSPEIHLVPSAELKPEDLNESSVLIIISSPNLAEDTRAIKMINTYGEELIKNNRIKVDGIPRVFKVHKLPYDDEQSLSAFHNIIGYDFYMIDSLSGEAQEFKRFFGNDAERGYWMKLVDMAYDIHQINITKVSTKSGVQVAEIIREKTVYLASTGVDMVIQRDIIKRELIRHGYRVLPESSLPKEIHALEAMVKNDLDRCRLSIHLIGEDYGYKPRGSELSVVDIQNRVASDHTANMVEYNKTAPEKVPFSRLIWVSPDLKNVTERQKIFIEDLKSDAAGFDEAEVLQITLQELKAIIREELVTGGRFNTHRDIAGYDQTDAEGSKVIYLILDQKDKSDAKPIRDFLEKSGYKVVSPSFEGDLIDIRYIHQENLRRCDASIIYFGKAKEAWIRTKLQDLLKAPGFGRSKKLQAKAVYCEGAKEVDKAHYEKNNALLLGNNGGFKPEHLAPFLTKLGK